MHALLFVYGSLVSAARHPQGERLRLEAELLGPARLQARLFRVSWYPCITLSDDATDQVHGEVYRLRDPATALTWLDAYEGITPSAESVAAADEYRRQIVTVTDQGDQPLSAWVYLYSRNTAGLERVQTGIWSGT
jgi:gamma-glutamylcyclotransferase (GGCT)/AIG2-like uncharacterized protein YtfP